MNYFDVFGDDDDDDDDIQLVLSASDEFFPSNDDDDDYQKNPMDLWTSTIWTTITTKHIFYLFYPHSLSNSLIM